MDWNNIRDFRKKMFTYLKIIHDFQKMFANLSKIFANSKNVHKYVKKMFANSKNDHDFMKNVNEKNSRIQKTSVNLKQCSLISENCSQISRKVHRFKNVHQFK